MARSRRAYKNPLLCTVRGVCEPGVVFPRANVSEVYVYVCRCVIWLICCCTSFIPIGGKNRSLRVGARQVGGLLRARVFSSSL